MKIGIDIGGSNIRIGLYKKENLQKYQKINSRFLNEENSRCVFIDKIKSFINENTSFECIEYIAIAVPGTISKDNSRIISSPNLRVLNNWAIKSDIEELIGCKVYLFKDVNALLAYDIYINKIDLSKSNVCAFYLGTGLGNALMINGQILEGNNNCAGELGHIPVKRSLNPCNCGSFYCAEIIVSGIRLEAIAKQLNIVDISNIFNNSHYLIDEFIDKFAAIIAIELNIIDPKYIIISGGVCNMKFFPKIKLLNNIDNYLRKPIKVDNYKVLFTENSENQGPLGAIICASIIRKEYYE